MIEKDLLLGEHGDLEICYGDLQLSRGTQSIRQRIRQALLTFKGEWFLNENLGIPYYQEILGQKNSLSTIKAIFIDALQGIKGVAELQSLDIKLDEESRSLLVKFTIIDTSNNIIKMEL